MPCATSVQQGTSVSSPEAGGWQKLAKVARRRSPAKETSVGGGAGALMVATGSAFGPLATLGFDGDASGLGLQLGEALGLDLASLKWPKSLQGQRAAVVMGSKVGRPNPARVGRCARALPQRATSMGPHTAGRVRGLEDALGPQLVSPMTRPSEGSSHVAQPITPVAGSSGGSKELLLPESAKGLGMVGVFQAGGWGQCFKAEELGQLVSELEKGSGGVREVGAEPVVADGDRVEVERLVVAAAVADGGDLVEFPMIQVSHLDTVARVKAALEVQGLRGVFALGVCSPVKQMGRGHAAQ